MKRVSQVHPVDDHSKSGCKIIDPSGFQPYFFEDSFDDELEADRLLEPFSGSQQSSNRVLPKQLPSYWALIWSRPVLAFDYEQHCFRQMNIFKYRASKLQALFLSCAGCHAMLDQLAKLRGQILGCRNFLVECNLRLVLSLAKRFSRRSIVEFDELVGAGNESLLGAVDRFDYRRGFRFNTYAYRVIERAMVDVFRRETRFSDRKIDNAEELVRAQSKPAGTGDPSSPSAIEASEQVQTLLASLDPRARHIVMTRFGLGKNGHVAPFRDIAQQAGLSISRVIQIFNRSLCKMKRTVSISAPKMQSHSPI